MLCYFRVRGEPGAPRRRLRGFFSSGDKMALSHRGDCGGTFDGGLSYPSTTVRPARRLRPKRRRALCGRCFVQVLRGERRPFTSPRPWNVTSRLFSRRTLSQARRACSGASRGWRAACTASKQPARRLRWWPPWSRRRAKAAWPCFRASRVCTPHQLASNPVVVYGSIRSWTGICSTSGSCRLFTVWNLTGANTDHPWDHILTGNDPFEPGAP